MPLTNKNVPYAARIFCIGRNYADHARELGSEIPKKPVVFIKPSTCLVPSGGKIHFPSHGRDLHHEAELVIQIGKEGRIKTEQEALSFVSAVTLGLDLTLRDVQNELKQKGLPWEKAKCFEQSAPIGDFITYNDSINLNNISFECKINSVTKQQGNTGNMIFKVEKLLVELSRIWIFKPGDLIYTGTPAGVGSLRIGDFIVVESEQLGSFSWTIIE